MTTVARTTPGATWELVGRRICGSVMAAHARRAQRHNVDATPRDVTATGAGAPASPPEALAPSTGRGAARLPPHRGAAPA
ncbi:MAG: hypothetical protein HZY76_19525 [Anaerolineae bacterium]|nr:MAG: hypothetical protein HZY76_19525 [Anaerolineae bacterium]